MPTPNNNEQYSGYLDDFKIDLQTNAQYPEEDRDCGWETFTDDEYPNILSHCRQIETSMDHPLYIYDTDISNYGYEPARYFFCENKIGFQDNTNFENVLSAAFDAMDVEYGYSEIDLSNYFPAISLAGWDTQYVTDVASVFNRLCTNGKIPSQTDYDVIGSEDYEQNKKYNHFLYMHYWEFPRVTSLNRMFYGKSVTMSCLLGMGTWTFGNLSSVDYMFSDANIFGDINLPELIGTDLSAQHMFDNLTVYGYSGGSDPFSIKFNGNNISNADYMFNAIHYGTSNTNIVVSEQVSGEYGYNPFIEVTRAEYMFANIQSGDSSTLLLDSDATYFRNLIDASHMFDGSTIYMSSDGTEYGYYDTDYGVNMNGITIFQQVNMSYMFSNATFHDFVMNAKPNNVFHMFDGATAEGYCQISWNYNMDLSYITDASYMFYNLTDANRLTYAGYSMSSAHMEMNNVTNFSHMFQNTVVSEDYGYPGQCPIDAMAGQNFDSMFEHCQADYHSSSEIKTCLPICLYATTVTDNATSMINMFKDVYVESLDYADYTEWELGASEYGYEFSGSSLEHWDMSNVVNKNNMFAGTKLFDGNHADASSSYNTTHTLQLVLPTNINFKSSLTGYDIGFETSNIHGIAIDDIHIEDQAMLDRVKYFFGMGSSTNPAPVNQITYLVARNWTFDSSITSLAGLFSRMPMLAHVDLRGWDVSGIQDFSNMFVPNSDNYTSGNASGVIDYSSLDNWILPPSANYHNMCGSNLQYESFITDEAYHHRHRFPNWLGTWDETGLTTMQMYEYECYTFDQSNPDPTPPDGFGTFTPTPLTLQYSWDFNDGLIDSIHGLPMQFLDNGVVSTEPAEYQYDGHGIYTSDSLMEPYRDLVIPVNLLEPGTVLEIDFGDFATASSGSYYIDGDRFISSYEPVSSTDSIGWDYGYSYDSPWNLSKGSGMQPTSTGTADAMCSENLFQNSTVRLECLDYHHLQDDTSYIKWNVYKVSDDESGNHRTSFLFTNTNYSSSKPVGVFPVDSYYSSILNRYEISTSDSMLTPSFPSPATIDGYKFRLSCSSLQATVNGMRIYTTYTVD